MELPWRLFATANLFRLWKEPLRWRTIGGDVGVWRTLNHVDSPFFVRRCNDRARHRSGAAASGEPGFVRTIRSRRAGVCRSCRESERPYTAAGDLRLYLGRRVARTGARRGRL